MLGIDNHAMENIVEKTGILQSAEKLGGWIVKKGLAKAIPLAGKLATQSGMLGKIGLGCTKFLGGAAGFMAGPLGPIVGEIVGQLVIYAATNALTQVAKKLNLISTDDKAEEIGYRLEVASQHNDWKCREDFATFGEYYDYLRQQVPDETIDPARLHDDRLYYTAMGGNALRLSIAEHYHMDIPIDMLIEIGRCHLDGDSLQEIMERFSAEGYNLGKFREYLQGELKGIERSNVEQYIAESLMNVYPEYSPEQLANKLREMRNASRDERFLESTIYQQELESIRGLNRTVDSLNA